MNAWLYLAAAITTEVTATLCLRASEGFSRLGFTAVVVVGYVASFWCLAQSLERGMSLGVAYGVWSGIGVATVALLGKLMFDDGLSLVTVGGIALIIAGVVVVQLGGTQVAT